MAWQIEQERYVDPEQGRDTERAIALALREAGGRTCQVSVEYVRGAPTMTAWQAVAEYLDWPTPPRRLIVDGEGRVTIAV
jgi:hypothetical protein